MMQLYSLGWRIWSPFICFKKRKKIITGIKVNEIRRFELYIGCCSLLTACGSHSTENQKAKTHTAKKV